MSLLLYFIAHDPVLIFQAHFSDVIDAFETSYLPIANGHYAEYLLSSHTMREVEWQSL